MGWWRTMQCCPRHPMQAVRYARASLLSCPIPGSLAKSSAGSLAGASPRSCASMVLAILGGGTSRMKQVTGLVKLHRGVRRLDECLFTNPARVQLYPAPMAGPPDVDNRSMRRALSQARAPNIFRCGIDYAPRGPTVSRSPRYRNLSSNLFTGRLSMAWRDRANAAIDQVE